MSRPTGLWNSLDATSVIMSLAGHVNRCQRPWFDSKGGRPAISLKTNFNVENNVDNFDVLCVILGCGLLLSAVIIFDLIQEFKN
jgi:hypothetical protein